MYILYFFGKLYSEFWVGIYEWIYRYNDIEKREINEFSNNGETFFFNITFRYLIDV